MVRPRGKVQVQISDLHHWHQFSLSPLLLPKTPAYYFQTADMIDQLHTFLGGGGGGLLSVGIHTKLGVPPQKQTEILIKSDEFVDEVFFFSMMFYILVSFV